MVDFIPARITALKAKLAARQGKKEFAESVKQIEAELARLEAPAPAPATSTADPKPVRGAE